MSSSRKTTSALSSAMRRILHATARQARSVATRGVALASAFFVMSCSLIEPGSQMSIHAYVGDARDLFIIRRVAVLPVFGPDVPDAQRESLHASLVSELGALHRFQIVRLDDVEEVPPLYGSEKRGRIDVNALVELGGRYHVDAVLLARVTSYKPYMPPVIGLQLHLVSVHAGDVVWVVDETFDGSQERVRQDLLYYQRQRLSEEPSLHDTDMLLMSPRRFGRYSMARAVDTLRGIDIGS